MKQLTDQSPGICLRVILGDIRSSNPVPWAVCCGIEGWGCPALPAEPPVEPAGNIWGFIHKTLSAQGLGRGAPIIKVHREKRKTYEPLQKIPLRIILASFVLQKQHVHQLPCNCFREIFKFWIGLGRFFFLLSMGIKPDDLYLKGEIWTREVLQGLILKTTPNSVDVKTLHRYHKIIFFPPAVQTM